mmetsp:Transcript_21006/g.47051  ORF Transcript_21006/g.47051 Transcript_21006/m.47051 type:complete len:611 (-) Transcript_21006:86-1918(-)
MDSTVLRVLQAAAEGDASVVAGLLEQGACPNAEGTFGQRPAHAAAEAGNAAVLAVLMNAKADVSAKNSLGHTALHVAAYAGHVKAVEELLNSAPEPHAMLSEKTTYEQTALDLARIRQAEPVEKTLTAAISKELARIDPFLQAAEAEMERLRRIQSSLWSQLDSTGTSTGYQPTVRKASYAGTGEAREAYVKEVEVVRSRLERLLEQTWTPELAAFQLLEGDSGELSPPGSLPTVDPDDSDMIRIFKRTKAVHLRTPESSVEVAAKQAGKSYKWWVDHIREASNSPWEIRAERQTVAGGERGVLASASLPSGDVIGPLSGTVYRLGRYQSRYYRGGSWLLHDPDAYKFSTKVAAPDFRLETLVLDQRSSSNPLRYLRDCRLEPLFHPAVRRPNVKLQEVLVDGWPYVFAIATAYIEPGTELLVDHGTNFWEKHSSALAQLRRLDVIGKQFVSGVALDDEATDAAATGLLGDQNSAPDSPGSLIRIHPRSGGSGSTSPSRARRSGLLGSTSGELGEVLGRNGSRSGSRAGSRPGSRPASSESSPLRKARGVLGSPAAVPGAPGSRPMSGAGSLAGSGGAGGSRVSSRPASGGDPGLGLVRGRPGSGYAGAE